MGPKEHAGVEVDYEAPELVILGTVRDLTEAGVSGEQSDGVLFLRKPAAAVTSSAR